ncbi:MAG: lysine--tRNA ligase, partial [Patescibacteria group bacterium]
MQWLNHIVDELIARHPDGEVLVESGSAPSGTYHLGHLREVLTPDAIYVELRKRGRQARHIHFVDDLDALRKVPHAVPAEYEKYLGMPLCDIPAPDGSDRSYADFFLADLQKVCVILGIEVEFVRSYQKYRSGFDVPAIEKVMGRLDKVRSAIQDSSSRELTEDWVPIQFLVDGRFKNRRYRGINTDTKTITYEDADGHEATVRYDIGEVKLDWRLDWPARWWMLNVHVEPFGRDHSSAGSSYSTGAQLMHDVFNAEPPLPVPYEFINMVGDTKKMSASKGTGLSALESAQSTIAAATCAWAAYKAAGPLRSSATTRTSTPRRARDATTARARLRSRCRTTTTIGAAVAATARSSSRATSSAQPSNTMCSRRPD